MNENILSAAKMDLLSNEKIKLIHNASLTILEEVGVRVFNKEAIELLNSIGAYVGDHGIVRIPSYIVERALRRVPKKITMYDRIGNVSMVLEDRNIYFGSLLDNYKYLDPRTDKTVDFTTSHMVGMTRLVDSLHNFDFIDCIGLLTDVNPHLASRMAFSIALQNSTKTINVETSNSESLKDIIEMAAVVAGNKTILKRKPFIFHYAEPISPLTHDSESVEKLFICADAGIPVVYMPYCMMGGTSPLSFAATLAQTNAEILSGLVIHQAKNEGAPFIVGSMPATFDMKTTIGTYGSPELHMMVAAASELSHYYDMPFYGTCGCTDAKSMDYQTVMEVTMSVFSSLLSRPNMVHDTGIMNHGKTISPELVLLVNEIIDMLKLYRNGIEVNNETLALDLIKEIGPGGHYLSCEHTCSNFRKIWYSEFLDRSIGDDAVFTNERIKNKTIEIIENYEPEFLSVDVLKDVKEIERKWMKTLE